MSALSTYRVRGDNRVPAHIAARKLEECLVSRLKPLTLHVANVRAIGDTISVPVELDRALRDLARYGTLDERTGQQLAWELSRP